MPIKVTCKCGTKFTARDELVGKKVECTACGRSLEVRAPLPGKSTGMVATVSALAVGVVASGVLIFMLQGRVSDLHSKVVGDAETNQAEMTKAKERLGEVEDELGPLKKKQKKQKKELDAVGEEATRLRSRIESLTTELNKIPGQIAESEESDKQKLENKATELRGLITDLETKKLQPLIDEQNDLAADYSLTLTRVTELENEQALLLARASELERGELLVESKILSKIRDNNGPLRKGIIKDVEQKLAGASREQPFQTVVGEDETAGRKVYLRMDTRSGQTSYWMVNSLPGAVSNDPGVIGKPGRFELRITFDQDGDVYDAVRLDTDAGRIWYCDIAPGFPSPRWVEIPVFMSNRAQIAATDRWRLAVTRGPATSSAGALLVLTDPAGFVYDDSFSSRGFMLQQ